MSKIWCTQNFAFRDFYEEDRNLYGQLHINNGPLRINYCPLCINYGPLLINYGPLRKITKCYILHKKTPITKPFLTFDQIKMLKSGFPDMIPEKNFLLVINPLTILYGTLVYSNVLYCTVLHCTVLILRGYLKICYFTSFNKFL